MITRYTVAAHPAKGRPVIADRPNRAAAQRLADSLARRGYRDIFVHERRERREGTS